MLEACSRDRPARGSLRPGPALRAANREGRTCLCLPTSFARIQKVHILDFLIIKTALEVAVFPWWRFLPQGEARHTLFLLWSKVRVCGRKELGLIPCVGWCDCAPAEWLLGTVPCVRKLLLVKLEVIIGQYLAMLEGTEKAVKQKREFLPLPLPSQKCRSVHTA